ncbi:glycine--tRNA ligase subunit beta [Aliiroseovarius crassostreae]|uniref:glycine--tRNA ligase subunit beta n=1 Tax=Aliiroseovarius crassostreae TaxID=154981 RepID=UPI0021AEB4C5|nr:glycine--tRNA ligase subunit beta [Aliiroseovarius crassostreae]UWP97744.1 glycine--tRNA ligase subunit beta [Aliiroseovarius crassostreae]
MPDLLIELFSEEIPARMQTRAAQDLKKLVTDGLVEAGLTYAGAHALSTPRRLTLAIDGLLAASPDTREERKGPKVGAPDKAIEGFLRGAGLTRDQLVERDTPKGPVYFAMIENKGRPAAEIIAEVLEKTIRNFPWPKSMRWGSGSLKWVRPLHSILCILSDEAGADVVPMEVDGIRSGDTTQGHRFMAPGAITVTGFEDYAAKLKSAKVVLDPQERADHIWEDAKNAAFAQGLEIVEDTALLREVAGLVEWPVVLMGDIADDFIPLPPEVLQTSMREHQKFFSVKNPKTDRIEKFITVANVETADNGATILAGNQKVLFARLADAKFFWENDIREAEAGGQKWLDSLTNVTFHNKLGTQAARIDRIATLARAIAPSIGADADLAERAARWAKADLSSEMVYEFPELQGLMGKYYAGPAGHPLEVANAATEHYSPLGPSDDVPSAPTSVAVALADKLDTLTGFWAIDEKPTGSKDPFALRRAALGVIRLVLENGLRTSIVSVCVNWMQANDEICRECAQEWHAAENKANESMPDSAEQTKWLMTSNSFQKQADDRAKDVAVQLLSFFHDRLKVYLKDQGIRHDVIDACLAMPGNDDLALLVKRAEALSGLLKTDDGENLLQGFKRANNILTQAEEKDGVEYSYGADVKFAEDDSEKALFAALDTAEAAIQPAMEAENFATAMTSMATLRAPIDAFFEAVQINTENEIIRRNRLNLLSRIRQICLSVADLTKVEG